MIHQSAHHSRKFRTSNGQVFESPFSNKEAIDRLRDIPGDFAADLRRKAEGRGLTREQLIYAHKLAVDHEQGKSKPRRLENVAKLFEVFASAKRAGLINPKFHVRRGSVDLYFYQLGSYKGQVGDVAIRSGKYRREWAAKLSIDGTLTPRQPLDAGAIALIEATAADPATVAAETGKELRQCSFCRRPLSDPRSREVGYGEICANKFGLPWG